MQRFTHPVYRHRLLQVVADAVFVAAAFYLAFRLRFLELDNGVPPRYEDMLTGSIGFVVVGKLLIFAFFGLYEKWWRYFRLPDMLDVVKATALSMKLNLMAFLIEVSSRFIFRVCTNAECRYRLCGITVAPIIPMAM